MLLRKESREWRGISSKKWGPAKVKAWDMREHGICLEYSGYRSVTNDKVLKVLMRNWRRRNCQTCLPRFLTSNWTDGGAIHWNGGYWERTKFDKPRLLTWYYTHCFRGVQNIQMKISNKQVDTWIWTPEERWKLEVPLGFLAPIILFIPQSFVTSPTSPLYLLFPGHGIH